jgi:aryl-alcohol dehydrogenase-like predicted oxidoreductase
MRYRVLGRSGLRVSELCLGTMTFGEEWGWGADAAGSRAQFEAFAEAGGNFVDTANRYTEGTSERLVGEFVGADRDHWVVATKYTLFDRQGDPNFSGNHRKNLTRSLEASLKRLGFQHVDLLWVHAWDFSTPSDEVMRALDDAVRAGKVLHVGISDTPAWVVARCNTLAELRGSAAFVALQVEYSLIERTPERELLPMARAFDLAVTPWAALAGGLLSGKYTTRAASGPTRLAPGAPRLSERNLAIARAVDTLAQELGRPASQVALNWVRQQAGTVIPILGARRVEQLRENLGCLEFSLTREQVRVLDEVSQVELGFPHEFLSRDFIRDLIYGGVQGRLELPPHVR